MPIFSGYSIKRKAGRIMYLRIHEAAERIGCSTSTLRSYDKKGILVPVIRTEWGERRYSEEQLKQYLVERGIEYET